MAKEIKLASDFEFKKLLFRFCYGVDLKESALLFLEIFYINLEENIDAIEKLISSDESYKRKNFSCVFRDNVISNLDISRQQYYYHLTKFEKLRIILREISNNCLLYRIDDRAKMIMDLSEDMKFSIHVKCKERILKVTEY